MCLKVYGYKSIKYWHLHAVSKQISLFYANSPVLSFLGPHQLLILTAGATVGPGTT